MWDNFFAFGYRREREKEEKEGEIFPRFALEDEKKLHFHFRLAL